MSLPKIALWFIIGLGIGSTSCYVNNVCFFESYCPVLIGFIVSTYRLIELQAILHADKIHKGISPNHFKANVLRIIVSIAVASLFHVYNYDIEKVFFLCLFSLGWFGIHFTMQINYYLSRPLLSIGDTAMLDVFFNNLVGRQHGYKASLIFYFLITVAAGTIYLNK